MVTNLLLVVVLLLLLILLIKQSRNNRAIDRVDDIAKIHESIGILKGYIESLGTSTTTNIQDVKSAVDKIEEYFTNTRSRGTVGERLLDEALRSFGFVEGRDYLKQKEYVINNVSIKPDVTFLLPNQMSVYIDSKFPLDNYRKYLETKDSSYLDKLANDVQKTIKDLSTKPYINENTVDFILMFIGSEAVYDIIYENYYNLFEEAFNNRIIICSPTNLYPILAVLRRLGEYNLFNSYKSDIFSAVKKVSLFMEEYDQSLKNSQKAISKLSAEIIKMEKMEGNIRSILNSIGSLQPGFSLANIDLSQLSDSGNMVVVNPNYGIDLEPDDDIIEEKGENDA